MSNAGMDDYISKPIRAQEMFEKLRTVAAAVQTKGEPNSAENRAEPSPDSAPRREA